MSFFKIPRSVYLKVTLLYAGFAGIAFVANAVYYGREEFKVTIFWAVMSISYLGLHVLEKRKA